MPTVAELKDWLGMAESTLATEFAESRISQKIYDQLKSRLASASRMVHDAEMNDGSFAGADALVEASGMASNFVSEAADAGVTIAALQ